MACPQLLRFDLDLFLFSIGNVAFSPRNVRLVWSRPPDLALIPIGAYEPRWFMAPMHMNPAEAVAWHQASGARRSLAMHWGTFQLSDEGRDDPIKALAAARASNGIAAEDFSVVAPGESVVV